MVYLRKALIRSYSLVLFLIIFLDANDIFSQTVWQQNGVPICTAPHSQEQIKITSDENGGAIIVWQDNRITGDLNIYAQRVDGNGNTLWSSNGVAVCNALGDQYTPEIVPDHEGGAIIVWRDYRAGNADIYAQRVSSNGEVRWQIDGLPICTAIGEQRYPKISYDDVNNWVIITWQDQRNGNWDIGTQKLTVYGDIIWQNDGVPVCQSNSDQMYPLVMADNIFQASIFIWIDNRNGMESLFIQRLDVNGIIQWEVDGKLVYGNVQGLSSQNIGITTDLEGGVIITWGNDLSDNRLYSQRIDDTGTFWWSEPGIIVSTVSSLSGVEIFNDLGPGAYICWVDNNQLYAQHVSDGTNIWSDGVSVAPSANNQSNPKLIVDYDSNIIVTWQESSEIKAQSIDTNGNIQWNSNGIFITNIDEIQTLPQICKDGSGGAVIAWEDFRNEQINTDIYVHRVNNSITVELTLLYPNGNELLAGGSIDTIQWTATNTDQFDHYFLAYTTDGGFNYTVIANNIIPTTTTSYEWTVPNINSKNVKILIQALSADNNTIYAEDESDAVFTIDSSPPGPFNLVDPANGTWTDATPYFVWDDSDGANYYQIWIDDILTEDNITVTNDYANIPLSAGWHTWTVKAVDNAGNMTQANNTWSIQVDINPPDAFNLINPEHDTWTNDPYTEFSWEPSNDIEAGLDKYMIYMDDILKYVDYYPENGVTYTYGDIIGFSEGTHTWFVKAVDNVDNETISNETRIINLDTTPPKGSSDGFSLYFDGNEDYVEVPHNNILNPSSQITIEAWVKFEVGGLQNPRIAGKGTGWGIGYELFTLGTGNSRKLSFALMGSTISSSIYYSSGEWHHIAGVYNGNSMKLYINGIERASRSKSGSVSPGTGSFKIGKKSHHWSDDDFKGEIDEVRVWNIARTQSEIENNKDLIISPDEPGLIGYWRFDEGTGSQVADLTNNQNHGNLIENTSFTINPNLSGESFALVSPENDYWTSNSTPTFVWNTAVDTGIGNSHYQLWINDSLYVDNIPFTDTTYTLLAGSELSNGGRSWFIKAFDLLGNNSRSNLVYTVNIDLEPPNSFSLLSPDDSTYVTFPTPNFSWYQSWDTGSGLSHFQLWIDSTLNVNNISGYVSSPSSPLTEGHHTWFVRAIDNVGNIQTTETRIVFGEWSPPLSFDLVSPEDGDTIQTSSPVFFWHPSSDVGTGLQKYQLWIGNSLNRDNILPTDTSITPANPLENGQYNWFVKAVDFAGNITSSISIWTFVVNVDYIPPISQITYPADGDTIGGISVEIQGTSTDGTGIGVDSVFVSTDNGQSWYLVQRVNENYDRWTYLWENFSYGDYIIRSRAKDIGGNREIPGDSIWVHVKNSLPFIVNPLPDLTLIEDGPDTSLFSLDSVFSDLNVGDTLLYTYGVIPSDAGININIDESTHIPTVKLEENWSGNAQAIFSAMDNQLDIVLDTVLITVLPINDAPLITSADSVSATEDLHFKYLATASDIEDSTIVFNFENLPCWLSSDADSVYGVPSEGMKDTSFVAIASDGELNDTLTVALAVISVNDPPYFTELMPDSILFDSNVRDTLLLTGLASDVDNPDSTLNWSYAHSSFVLCDINGTLNSAIFWVEENMSGQDTVVLSVSDGEFTVYDSLIVIVSPVTGIEYLMSQLPKEYSLKQNYPNPFNPTTTIIYGLPKLSHVDIRIYDLLGREVTTLVNDNQEAKHYKVIWDAKDRLGNSVPSGMYLYRIVAKSGDRTFVKTRKLLLMR